MIHQLKQTLNKSNLNKPNHQYNNQHSHNKIPSLQLTLFQSLDLNNQLAAKIYKHPELNKLPNNTRKNNCKGHGLQINKLDKVQPLVKG